MDPLLIPYTDTIPVAWGWFQFLLLLTFLLLTIATTVNLGVAPYLCIAFALSLMLTVGGLATALRQNLWLAIGHALALVLAMISIRSWLRTGYLGTLFPLDQLQVIPQYSPMIFFFVTLASGIICLIWLIRKTTKIIQ